MEHGFHWPMVFIHGIGDFSSIKGGKGKWKRHAFRYCLFGWEAWCYLVLGDAPIDKSWVMDPFNI